MKSKKITLRDLPWIIAVMGAFLGAVYAAGTGIERAKADDINEIDALIDTFQETYSAKDASGLRALFYADAVVAMDATDGEEQSIVSLDEWIINTRDYVFEENDHISDVLSNREIHVFRNIGYAVCDYNYQSDNKTAQGVDVLTFCKKRGTWKIVSLQWTGDEFTK